jgi:hypothetical protein
MFGGETAPELDAEAAARARARYQHYVRLGSYYCLVTPYLLWRNAPLFDFASHGFITPTSTILSLISPQSLGMILLYLFH